MKTKLCISMVAVLCVMFLAAGCEQKGGSSAVDETKPLSEVKAEAEKMDVEKLKATALKYKEAILAKESDVRKLMDQLKEIPLAQQIGDEAKTLQVDIENLNKSVTALRDRFQVYYDKLKELKADVTGLEL